MSDTITVKSGLQPGPDGAVKVALWEQDPAHPDGEVFIAGEEPVVVGRTAAVARKLADGELVEVKAETKKPAAPPAT